MVRVPPRVFAPSLAAILMAVACTTSSGPSEPLEPIVYPDLIVQLPDTVFLGDSIPCHVELVPPHENLFYEFHIVQPNFPDGQFARGGCLESFVGVGIDSRPTGRFYLWWGRGGFILPPYLGTWSVTHYIRNRTRDFPLTEPRVTTFEVIPRE